MIKKIHIISFISVVIFFLVVMILSPSGKEIVEAEISKNLGDEYIGIVTDNYYDRKEHNFKTTLIETNEGVRKIRHIRDTSGLFEYIIVGDSIWKYQGNMEVKVKRGESIRLFEIIIPRVEKKSKQK